MNRITINRVALTGPEREIALLWFGDGLNIVWGASNAGKSFIRRAIDYVLGGDDKLMLPPEGIGYDNCLLWLTTSCSGPITLRRSTLGGDVYKADGHLDRVDTHSDGYEALKSTHASVSPNVSKTVLSEAGFDREYKLLKNERAEKISFSLRFLARYLIVDETRMIDEKSVLLSHGTSVTAADRGLIRFLLTGVDGSSVETVQTRDQLVASRDGKIVLLSEMAEEIRAMIDQTRTMEDVKQLLEIAETERDQLSEVLQQRQARLAAATSDLQHLDAEILSRQRKSADLQAMIIRFEELAGVYASDLERLAGLEEGGFLLQKFATMNCPLCGADPEHQEHDHGLSDVEAQRAAVSAEMVKIAADSSDLQQSIKTAAAEVSAIDAELESLREGRLEKQNLLKTNRSVEFDARKVFVAATKRVEKLENSIAQRGRLTKLEDRRAKLEEERIPGRPRAAGIDENFSLTGPEGHALAKVIKRVLKAWNYPGGDAVHYVPALGDIQVDGKDRKDNGAGVRALLHSAFKVAVLLYCQENGRPHPGFLILDAPLMAFAEAAGPNGELTDEAEQALVDASVATHFYEHLNGLSGKAQFIIIENHKDSPAIPSPFPNVRFTGDPETGREGFFTKDPKVN